MDLGTEDNRAFLKQGIGMKRLILPGAIFLCSAIVLSVRVFFPGSTREALGRWFETVNSLNGVLLLAASIWLLFHIAQMGRKGSQELPNHDRTAGNRIGFRIILGGFAGMMSPLLLHSGVLDPDRTTSGWFALALYGVASFLFLYTASWAWRSRQTWNGEEIAYRGALGWETARWSDFRRIEHGTQYGQITFHFADHFSGRKKFSVMGAFHEAADELIEFAQGKMAEVQQLQKNGPARAKGTVVARTSTRILLLLVMMSLIGLMGYLFWSNTVAVAGNMTLANMVWAVLSAGAGLYLLYLAWLMKGPHYLWYDQYLVHFDHWRRSSVAPWKDLQAVELAREDTESCVLAFSGDLKLKVEHSLKGASDLIAYAESRLNNA